MAPSISQREVNKSYRTSYYKPSSKSITLFQNTRQGSTQVYSVYECGLWDKPAWWSGSLCDPGKLLNTWSQYFYLTIYQTRKDIYAASKGDFASSRSSTHKGLSTIVGTVDVSSYCHWWYCFTPAFAFLFHSVRKTSSQFLAQNKIGNAAV